MTIIALVWANSAYHSYYHHFWHEIKFGFSFGDFELKYSLQHWINDGLMATFFFVIGLEIKREVIAGELSSLRKASLPIAAAIGGMVFPALFYVAFNYNNPQNLHGWGVPMATDIAFALGMLSLLGAILVIALFYTETINIAQLINAGIFLAILMGANRLGVRRATFYAIVDFLGVWLSFMFSGIHATIAGVHIEGNILHMLFHPVALGIMAGLVLGKVLGITLMSKLLVGLKLAVLPEGVTWKHIYGAGLLAGIGFTMSIFISGLAFADQELVQIAKIGVFGASVVSAIAGLLVLNSIRCEKDF